MNHITFHFFTLFSFVFLFKMEVEGNGMEEKFFCLCNTLSYFPTYTECKITPGRNRKAD